MASHGMADRLKGTEKNIWVEFGKLAKENQALNLGQGFPDFKPPQHVIDEMVTALMGEDRHHQYTRSYGHPRLIDVLANLYGPMLGRKVDPNHEVSVSVGAYGVLFCTVQGLINPGDEVIIVEPFFDCYEPMAKVAGGIPRFVPLRSTKTSPPYSSDDWKLDWDELAKAFNSKTKAIFINNPNNPCGKVFKKDELEKIAELCIKNNTICISDEVYEWLVYKPNQHIKIASLPGMWERTITIGSAGKTFSATGWKLGWAIGPQNLIHPLQVLHQNCIYTSPTPIQEAVAAGLEYEMKLMNDPQKCYFYSLAEELRPKRDKLAQLLTHIGLTPVIPEGGYFMLADISKFRDQVPDDGTDDPFDFKFVRWMTKEKKLAAIPPSAFYSVPHKDLGEKYVRFCFIKKDETLDNAAKILNDWNQG